VQRIRIHFAKTPAMRYTGHLDLFRAWERSLRRANLPLAYSQGFNPHPRINLAAALPLGFTSQAEIADIWLDPDVDLPDFEQALEPSLPPGIHAQGYAVVDLRAPALQTQVEAAEYEVTFLAPQPGLPERVTALLAQTEIQRNRRSKPYDLRPLILEMAPLPADESGAARLFLRMIAKENASGRPDEVIAALGADPAEARVHRTKLILAFSD
jgi:radical SAM-linked protein